MHRYVTLRKIGGLCLGVYIANKYQLHNTILAKFQHVDTAALCGAGCGVGYGIVKMMSTIVNGINDYNLHAAICYDIDVEMSPLDGLGCLHKHFYIRPTGDDYANIVYNWIFSSEYGCTSRLIHSGNRDFKYVSDIQIGDKINMGKYIIVGSMIGICLHVVICHRDFIVEKIRNIDVSPVKRGVVSCLRYVTNMLDD